MEITKQDLHRGVPMILRWGGKSPYPQDPESEYALNPGWRVPEQMDYFFTRLDEKTQLLQDVTLIPMRELDLDIDYLKTSVELDDVRRLKDYPADSSFVPGEQVQDIYAFDESVPQFSRDSMHVVRTVAFTEVPETFIDENLEKSTFLQTTGTMYMQQLGVAIEKDIEYGIKNPLRPNGRRAIDSLDGIFQQLRYVDQNYETGTDQPKGFGSNFSIGNGSIVKQFMEKIDEYIAQNGRDDYCKFYVSKVLYNKVLQEITTRETAYGDLVLQKGGNLSILDVPLVKLDTLNPLSDPVARNNWNHLAMLCDPASIAVGVYNGDDPEHSIKSYTSYQHNRLNYLTSWQVAFDTLLIWPQDVLAFDVIDGATGTFAIGVENSAKEGIEGATVEVYDLEADDPETPIATGTTASNGTVEIEGLAYGKYQIKVTADGYKDKTIDNVILNEAQEIEVIKLTRSS